MEAPGGVGMEKPTWELEKLDSAPSLRNLTGLEAMAVGGGGVGDGGKEDGGNCPPSPPREVGVRVPADSVLTMTRGH